MTKLMYPDARLKPDVQVPVGRTDGDPYNAKNWYGLPFTLVEEEEVELKGRHRKR